MIDSQREISFSIRCALAVLAPSLANSKLIGTESVLGAEVARTDAVRSSEQTGRFLRTKGWEISAIFVNLVRFAQGHPDIACQRVVPGQSFISSLQNDDILLAA